MMSNTSNVAAAPITTSTTTTTTTSAGGPSMAIPMSGLVSNNNLTSTGLPLAGAPNSGMTTATGLTSSIPHLAGTDAMMAPAASHITLPAPIMAPGQPTALLHGSGSGSSTIGQTVIAPLTTPLTHTTTTGASHTGVAAAPLATTGASHVPHHDQHHTAATAGHHLPHTTSSSSSSSTSTTHMSGASTTTTTTGAHHGGVLAGLKSHLPGHHGTTGATTTASTSTSTDKHVAKEVAKEQKELTKEEKKREKLMLKEQKKREKEEKKAMKLRAKEERKQKKLMMKEEEKRIEAQRALHMTAQKARMDKYRAEEKATTARLMSDVKEFDLAHAKTAPLGLYSEQVDDALPYVPENVGLFIAVARGLNLIDVKEAKADAYVRVLVLGTSADGKELVHAAHKSEVKSNTANPEWWFHADDTPHLVTENVGWLRTGKLRIEVWDHDKTSEDELLGSIEWPLSALDGKVTRGNFLLQQSQLPLATGRTVRKATKPGTIFVEIRYRSPFAFLGMSQQQQQQHGVQQQQGMMHQQQQQHGATGMHAMPMATGAPLLATGATHHTGMHTSGDHHLHHVQPVSSGGLSTVYKAPDVLMPAGSIAPGAISHTHHIHATALPATGVTGASLPVLMPDAHVAHGHAGHAMPHTTTTTTTTSSTMMMGGAPHLLGGEQKKEYRQDLLAQQPAGAHHHTVTPLISTADAVQKTGVPATPAEPHNITHNIPQPQKAGMLPSGAAAQPMVDAAPLGTVATGHMKPIGTTGITGAPQPVIAGTSQVGAVNLADPPRHVF